MNIFFLSVSPQKCARLHNDKHVVKMILEYAQLLSTAHRVLDGDDYADEVGLYRKTHVNHPSAIWTREDGENYSHLLLMFQALLFEYQHRYHKIHKTHRLSVPLTKLPENIPTGKGFSVPPQCMPDRCKVEDRTIKAYRRYYVMEKQHIAKWTNRPIPKWYSNGVRAMELLNT